MTNDINIFINCAHLYQLARVYLYSGYKTVVFVQLTGSNSVYCACATTICVISCVSERSLVKLLYLLS